jgi:hypothetical protein
LTLNLAKLLRDGFFQPNESLGGSIVGRNTATGERVSFIGYEAYLGIERGRVRLRYTSTQWDGTKHNSDYWIDLITTPQPFGGWRWWFLCPRTGKRVAKLYMPPGAATFCSRRACRLPYRSQREAPHDRALRRAFKIQARLGNPDGSADDWPPRPRGMRHKTYARLMNRLEGSQGVMDGHLCLLAARLMGKSRRA